MNVPLNLNIVLSQRLAGLLPGLVLSGLLAAAAITLGQLPWLQAHGLGVLTLAIVLGLVLGNTLFARVSPHVAPACASGVGFCRQTLLRLGIVLYGFRLTFQDIGQVGIAGVLIDALVLCSTFALALALGTRLFKLERNTVLLIGAGSSICGAAAIMATAPVVRGRPEQVSVAVATVVLFGTLAMFAYPLLYQFSLQRHGVALPPATFGIYIGSTVHEVAQVVAAARSIGPEAADAAVIAKMVRVMMLAPFLIALSAWLARKPGRRVSAPANRLAMPWFTVAFIAVVGFNSLVPLPQSLLADAIALDNVLLAMAMAALGLTTDVSALLAEQHGGLKPMLLAAMLFGWLAVGGAAINYAVTALL